MNTFLNYQGTVMLRFLILLCCFILIIQARPVYAQDKNTTTVQVTLPIPPGQVAPFEVPANTTSTIVLQITACTADLPSCSIPVGATIEVRVCNQLVSSTPTFGTNQIQITIPGNIIPNVPQLCEVSIRIQLADGTVLPYIYTSLRTMRTVHWLNGLSEEFREFWGPELRWGPQGFWNVGSSRFGYAPYFEINRLSSANMINYPTAPSSGAAGAWLHNNYGLSPILNDADVPSLKKAGELILGNPIGANSPRITQPTVPSSDLPIVIGHSMGGLVARSMARELVMKGGQNRFGGIITVGTPNQGAPVVYSVQSGLVGNIAASALVELGSGPATMLASQPIQAAAATLFGSCFIPGIAGIPANIPGTSISIGQLVNTAFSLGLPTAISPLISGLVTLFVSSQFRTGRPNVQDMYVVPDLSGGINGQGAPASSAPFMNEINSIIPSRGSINPVPVINIYGTTKHEQSQYSIGTTALERFPSAPPSQILCENIDILPQFKSIDMTNDRTVPRVIYNRVRPAYQAQQSQAAINAVMALTSGNYATVAASLFTSQAWQRGLRYIDQGAQNDYRKIVGAYRYVPIVNTTIFGFRLVVLSGQEEYFESDAFIPEWSQKSPGATFQFEAQKSNHLLQANTPEMKTILNNITSDPVNRRNFFIPIR